MSCFSCNSKKKRKQQLKSSLHLARLSKKFRLSPKEILLFMQRYERMSVGSGVTLMRFRESMGILGLEAVSAISDRIFSLMDEKGTGLVELEEYLSYMDVLMRGTREERLEQMFKLITFNSSEFITYDNFSEYLLSVWKMYNVLTGNRISVSEENIKAYFDALDTKQDGQIDIEEFMDSMGNVTSLFEWFDYISKGMAVDYTPPEPEVDVHAHLLERLQSLEQRNRLCMEILEEVKFDTFRESDTLRHPGDCDEPETPSEVSFYEEHLNSERLRPSEALLRVDSVFRPPTDSELQPLSMPTSPKNYALFKINKAQRLLRRMLKDVKAIKKSVKSQKEENELKRQNIEANVPKNKATAPKLMKKMSFVHWGDEDWNLVLTMMHGIQSAVRWAAASYDKEHDLTDFDFSRRVKHQLLKPQGSHKTFKFRDYAPDIFERVRRMYGINFEHYIKSLGVEKLMRSLLVGEFSSLIGLCSAGKSGSFFYYSEDGQYLLKTMTKTEFVFFRTILQPYYQHLKTHYGSFLPRFLGLHEMKYSLGHRTESLYFIVMANVFSTSLEIHERFDLKGSTYKRTTNPDADHSVARKDLDFLGKEKRILLGEERRSRLMEVIQKDCQFFQSHNIIDYSLLVGMHYFSPDEPEAVIEEDGGILAVDESCLYFIGIIDILTQYSSKKKFEHWFKSAMHGSDAVSCCPPEQYARRFYSFMETAIV